MHYIVTMFLVYTELCPLNSEEIYSFILSSVERFGLNMNKLIGCSTMTGHWIGGQEGIREKYSTPAYFHCPSHRLNLVLNNLKKIQEIRNTVRTMKWIMELFRESVLRRKLIPHIEILRETRWSHKYISMTVFKENFIEDRRKSP